MNYYAVKVGRNSGIYDNWKETQDQVNGFKGAIYQKFKTKEEAEFFLNEETKANVITNESDDSSDSSDSSESEYDIDELSENLDKDTAIIVTDGSYSEEFARYGYGLILITRDNKDIFYASGNDKRFVGSRNVAGEVFGVIEGLEICHDNDFTKVYIFYDYEGLENWYNKTWKSKAAISRYYMEMLKKYENMDLKFIKVKSHSGHYYNDQADKLATLSLSKEGSKTYEDGTVYFMGIEEEQLENIVKTISNEPNIYLDQTEKEDYKITYTLWKDKEKVVITYYNKNFSVYLQGKNSQLLSVVIEKIVQSLRDNNQINTFLNKVYKTIVKKDDVERKIETILPNYNNINEDNIDKIIYSSVYNLFVDGYKKDYSDLVHPIFRIQEHILHQILSGAMGFKTEKEDGSNNFGYFTREGNEPYYCNSKKKCALISDEQEKLLNKVYNFYATERNQYSHASRLDMDISIIEDIDIAKGLINKGHRLFDKYCEIF